MSNILQWQPEKSRVWANATIQNVHHIREDLGTLADWVKAKADSVALVEKASAAKVADLEKSLAAIQEEIVELRRSARQSAEETVEQLSGLERRLQAGEAALSEFRVLEESARTAAGETRQCAEQCAEHAAAALRSADDAKGAAALGESLRAECTALAASARAREEDLVRGWREAQDSLSRICGDVEQNAVKAGENGAAAANAAAEAAAAVQRAAELRDAVESSQTTVERAVNTWVREAETHAGAAGQYSKMTSSAAELAGKLKADCEGLIETLRMKADELTSTWQSTEREFATLAQQTELQAGKASEAAGQAESLLQRLLDSAKTSVELRAALEAGQADAQQRMAALEEMLRSASLQVNQSSEHRQVCQDLNSKISATEAQLRSLVQAIEEKVHRTDATMLEWDNQSGSFWARLKWLMLGGARR